jgi:hypothetical protein
MKDLFVGIVALIAFNTASAQTKNFTKQDSSVVTVQSQQAADTMHTDYPASFSESFINSCSTSSSGKTQACSCVLDKIKTQYSYQEFLEIYAKIKKGEQQPEFTAFMNKARKQCAQK